MSGQCHFEEQRVFCVEAAVTNSATAKRKTQHETQRKTQLQRNVMLRGRRRGSAAPPPEYAGGNRRQAAEVAPTTHLRGGPEC